MINAVIFDFNGTSLDDLAVSFGSIVEVFRRHGVGPPTLEEYRLEITSDFSKFYYDHGLPRAITPDQINKIRAEYYRANHDRVRLRSDFEPVLAELTKQGIQVAIVSGEVQALLLEKLEEAGLRKYFGDNIRGDVFTSKDQALSDMVASLGVSSYQAIYVDDTVDGNSAAKRAGLVPVAFTEGYNSADRLRTVTPIVINELSELLSIVNLFNHPESQLIW